MTRTYEYNGFSLQVAVESDCRSRPAKRASAHPGYVAVVRICEAGSAVPRLSQLGLGEAGGHPFDSEAGALNGGYIAARTIVDDLFGQDIADSIVMPLWQSPVTLPSPGVLLPPSERAKRSEKVPPPGVTLGRLIQNPTRSSGIDCGSTNVQGSPGNHPRASHHR
ncbi:hypothetical protein P3T23_006590 [Paraburkholderia sp. GAS448]|uniref:hypothetical protein n=1 Tax=Paraburkholderia sp. GAS448 TaxID=3035136 RepID=UPI003D1E325C